MSTLRTGQVVAGRFHLVREVGRGAMGAVWLVRDAQLEDELMACKFLRPALVSSAWAVASLKREVLLTRRLRHPNIPGVYTFWDVDGHCFISMEYVEGQSLAEAAAETGTPFSLSDVLRWIVPICSALDYAHEEGILHRDIKPANILLDSVDKVHLVDFGIARRLQDVSSRAGQANTGGTIMFMSPEQLQGQPLDRRSDVYSLASTVYGLLSGKPPFHEGAIVSRIQIEAPAPIAHVPGPVNRVLLHALAKRATDRPPTCGAFCTALLEAAGKEADVHRAAVQAAHPVPHGESPHDDETVALAAERPIPPHDRLGSILIDHGMITPRQLEKALARQSETGGRLGSILIDLGYVEEEEIAHTLEIQFQIPYIHLRPQDVDPAVAALISRREAEAACCIPLYRKGLYVFLAMADPLNMPALERVERACGGLVQLRLASAKAIQAAIDHAYGASAKNRT